MAESVSLVKVLVASPGDVQAERDALKQVVDQINHTIALQRRLLLFVVRWEDDVHAGFGEDAQDVVNQQIDFGSIDLFIGLLWKRFGTKTKRAASGTEEEFDRCFALWQERKQPQLMFYFNTLPFAPKDLKEHEEYGKVLAFRQRLADAGGLTGSYQGADDFQTKIRKDLTLFVNRFRAPAGHDARFSFAPASQPQASAADRSRRLGSAFRKAATLREHNFAVYGLAFSPDDRLLASGDRSGTIHLWDMEKIGKKQKGLVKTFTGHRGSIAYLAFSDDSKGLVSGSDDYELRLWDIERAPADAMRATVRGFSKTMHAFAPDGRITASERDGAFRLHDAVTFALEAEWAGHPSRAEVWTFSPDGSLIGSAHEDGAVLLWNVERRDAERTLRDAGEPARALAFSPDGTLLAACGRESAVRVWNVRSGKQVAELIHGVDRVPCLRFNQAGNYLASSDLDGVVILWERK